MKNEKTLIIPQADFYFLEKCDQEYVTLLQKSFRQAKEALPHYMKFDGYKIHEEEDGGRLMIASCMKPHFITPAIEAHIKERAELFMNILPRLYELFKTSKQAREYFHLTRDEVALIQRGPTYNHLLPIGRFDGIVSPRDGLRVYELNLNCPAAGGWTNTIYDMLKEFSAFQQFHKRRPMRVHVNWHKELLHLLLSDYQAWGGKNPHPRILVLRWKGQYNQDSDFFSQEFQKLGYHAVAGDATQVHYDGKKLWYHGTSYDLVLRWFDLDHVFEVSEAFQDILRAYYDNAVCMVNPLVSSVFAHKAFFAFFTDERFADHITNKERDVLGAMCPWTRIVEDRKTVGMDKETHVLGSYIVEQQKKLVLKRSISTYGKDIFIGKTLTPAVWKRVVRNAMKEGGWVAQELVTLEHAPEPYVTNGKVTTKKMYRDIDPYVLNGNYMQAIARFSPKLVTNSIQGGAAQIVATVKKT